MSEHLQSENRSTLAGIASALTFPYLWLGLFVLLAWLYNVGFFGRDIGSVIVPGLLCLVFLLPAVPLALTRYIVRPLFSNLLGREIIAAPGCITGLVSVVLAALATIYFLSRGIFDVAGMLLLAAPVVGALLTGGVTLLSRGGSLGLVRGRTAAPSAGIRVEKPGKPALSSARKPSALPSQERPALPTPSTRPRAIPAPRRSEKSSMPTQSTERNPPPATRSAPPRRKP